MELYAWVNPVGKGDMGYVPLLGGFNALVDHTWVTTYDSRQDAYSTIEEVVAHRQHYWYCWGVFHPEGSSAHSPGGFAGRAPADLGRASCLCQPDKPSKGHRPAQGTIFRYAINGVCHQLANQVLWATGTDGTPPLTVDLARGYWLSTALYGPYGRNWRSNAWARRKTTCSGGTKPAATEALDPFAARVQAVLTEEPLIDVRGHLLSSREAAARQIADVAERRAALLDDDAPATTAEEGEEINQIARDFQKAAANTLTAEQYRRIFELERGDALDLVDSRMLE